MLKKQHPLADLRDSIDSIDSRIMGLLNERANLVLEVGRLKQAESREFHVPNREREIYERLTAVNPGPFPNEALRSVFREIISASLALEAPMRVAFLGPKATFSHLATMQQFGLSAELVPQKSIPAVFEESRKIEPFMVLSRLTPKGFLPTVFGSELKIGRNIWEVSRTSFQKPGGGYQRSPHPAAVGANRQRTCLCSCC
jgi:chorismate mutase-like protein